MKIIFITSGVLPVPSIQGGAIETLADALALENEKSEMPNLDFTFLSILNEEAKAEAQKMNLHRSRYQYVEINKVAQCIDQMFFSILNNILKLSKAKKYRFIFQRLYFIRKCRKVLRKQDEYDLIIIENSLSLLSVVRFTKYYKKNYIYYAHNYCAKSLLNNKLFKRCSKVIAVSDYLNKKIQKVMGDIDSDNKKYCTLKNGINTHNFRPYTDNERQIIRSELGINENDFVFLFSGRLVVEKGIKQLILAFISISKKIPDVKLLVIGANSFGLNMCTNFEKEIIEIASNYVNKIIFIGFVSNDKMPGYYNSCNVAVLPSVWEEPAGLTMLEAIACGIPLITTDRGGIAEYIGKDSAILIKDPEWNLQEKLEKEMEYLISNQIKREELVRNGVQRASMFSQKIYYEEFKKMIIQ